MGTIAARDYLRVLQLTDQVVAAHLLATIQAVLLRDRIAKGGNKLSSDLKGFVESIATEFEFLEEDRALEQDLRQFVDLIQQAHWPLYGERV